MKGQWIIKEVYFEDGFPKIIRDLKPETPYTTLTDREESAEKPINSAEPLPIGKTMTSDDITRMARDANLPECHLTHPKALERFAALVAAAKQEEIESTLLRLHEQAADRHNYFQHAVKVIRKEI